MESSLYDRVCTKGPPKWGFGVILGVGAKIFCGKAHPSLELRVFRHLWFRSDAPYSRILYGETLGKFGGHQFPYQKPQETCAAGRHPLDLRLPHAKIVIILRCCCSLGCRLVTGRYVQGVLYMGKIGQNPKIGQIDAP